MPLHDALEQDEVLRVQLHLEVHPRVQRDEVAREDEGATLEMSPVMPDFEMVVPNRTV